MRRTEFSKFLITRKTLLTATNLYVLRLYLSGESTSATTNDWLELHSCRLRCMRIRRKPRFYRITVKTILPFPARKSPRAAILFFVYQISVIPNRRILCCNRTIEFFFFFRIFPLEQFVPHSAFVFVSHWFINTAAAALFAAGTWLAQKSRNKRTIR